tara:strand:- start:572 stop:679 length:108 start_codon:yes stop_codon:yes gene_type:complete
LGIYSEIYSEISLEEGEVVAEAEWQKEQTFDTTWN